MGPATMYPDTPECFDGTCHLSSISTLFLYWNCSLVAVPGRVEITFDRSREGDKAPKQRSAEWITVAPQTTTHGHRDLRQISIYVSYCSTGPSRQISQVII